MPDAKARWPRFLMVKGNPDNIPPKSGKGDYPRKAKIVKYSIFALITIEIILAAIGLNAASQLEKLQQQTFSPQYLLIPNPKLRNETMVATLQLTSDQYQESRRSITATVTLDADQAMRNSTNIGTAQLASSYKMIFDGATCNNDKPCILLLTKSSDFQYKGNISIVYPVEGSYGVFLVANDQSLNAATRSDTDSIHIVSFANGSSVQYARDSLIVAEVSIIIAAAIQLITAAPQLASYLESLKKKKEEAEKSRY